MTEKHRLRWKLSVEAAPPLAELLEDREND